MKTKFHLTVCLAGGLLLLCACTSHEPEQRDYTAAVNLFIGTGGHGHTHPGAMLPHGMIQPGPDTRMDGWDASSGYYYNDSTINGFAHTRLSGTGCADFGDFLLMPTVGEQHTQFLGKKSQQCAYASSFSHQNEHAEPGYYSVFLDTYGVKAELTATERAAMHRYTFPESKESGFIFDMDYSIQWQNNQQMEIEAVNDTVLRGYKRSAYWAYQQDLYFYAVFSKPFTHTLLTDTVSNEGKPYPVCKMQLRFPTAKDEQVSVRLAISSVDAEGARKNLETEMPDWNFDQLRADAKRKWNDCLSKIDIQTPDTDQHTIFYTAMYHANLSPNLSSDVDGRYRGMDLNIHRATLDKPMYTVFSLWDTFRALHPLMSIIDPHRNEAYIRALLKKGEEGGLVPKWDCASNYTGCMIGYHFVSLVTDAYVKGYRDFDVQAAYKAARRAAEYDTTGIAPVVPKFLYPYIMPKARYYKNTIGYVPCDRENESVAKALEYAYDDWCISVLADSLGDMENKARYARFAGAYEFYFDPSTRFMRGLDSKGEWRTPFSPRSSTHRNDDYCEGTAWQWTWFVPHDVPGLVDLMGGEKAFVEKLDSLFTAPSDLEGEQTSVDITGLIGQYAHGNEPSHHITHLYNYVNHPWKTQELVDNVLHNQYFNAPDGLSGNEDCGQMSAWYILNSMGFYQVCPGKPVYSIGRPLFNQVTINLPTGKTFVVRAKNNMKVNKYIQSAQLNGKVLDTPFFTHEDIEQGGILEVTMGATPTRWGVK